MPPDDGFTAHDYVVVSAPRLRRLLPIAQHQRRDPKQRGLAGNSKRGLEPLGERGVGDDLRNTWPAAGAKLWRRALPPRCFRA